MEANGNGFSTSLTLAPPTTRVLNIPIQPVLYKLVLILSRISRRDDTLYA